MISFFKSIFYYDIIRKIFQLTQQYLLINLFQNFYWSIVDLQCYVSFRYTAKWINYTYTCIHSFVDSFPVESLQSIEVEFPVLYSKSLLVIHFIHSTVYMSVTMYQVISMLPLLHGNHKLFSTSMSLCFINRLIRTLKKFFFNLKYVISYHICISLTSLSMTISRSVSVARNGIMFFFLWLSNIPCICVPPPLCPVFYWWTFRWLPCIGYCKESFSQHCGACVFLNYCFLWIYAEWNFWVIW